MHEENRLVPYYWFLEVFFFTTNSSLLQESYKYCSLHNQISCSHFNKNAEYAVWILDLEGVGIGLDQSVAYTTCLMISFLNKTEYSFYALVYMLLFIAF